MAAGAPVVCSDLPGYREAAGEAALFVPAGDAPGLAAALREVLATPCSATDLVEAGKARAARMDWRRVAPEILTWYEGGERPSSA
jgi:phosphatidylinositol alpha-mannosyltransferase